MAEKKGIRVNALAKELGVESKAILAKLRENESQINILREALGVGFATVK